MGTSQTLMVSRPFITYVTCIDRWVIMTEKGRKCGIYILINCNFFPSLILIKDTYSPVHYQNHKFDIFKKIWHFATFWDRAVAEQARSPPLPLPPPPPRIWCCYGTLLRNNFWPLTPYPGNSKGVFCPLPPGNSKGLLHPLPPGIPRFLDRGGSDENCNSPIPKLPRN